MRKQIWTSLLIISMLASFFPVGVFATETPVDATLPPEETALVEGVDTSLSDESPQDEIILSDAVVSDDRTAGLTADDAFATETPVDATLPPEETAPAEGTDTSLSDESPQDEVIPSDAVVSDDRAAELAADDAEETTDQMAELADAADIDESNWLDAAELMAQTQTMKIGDSKYLYAPSPGPGEIEGGIHYDWTCQLYNESTHSWVNVSEEEDTFPITPMNGTYRRELGFYAKLPGRIRLTAETTYWIRNYHDSEYLGIHGRDQQYRYESWVIDIIADPCTVYFDGNGGNCEISQRQVTYCEQFGSLPEATRDGYVFVGWYTQKNGGTKVFDFSTVPSYEDFTLYAHWGHVATFQPNGASWEPYTQVIQEGVRTKLEKAPTREKYVFTGWNTKPNGSGTDYADEEPITITSDVTLYAQWVPGITITFSGTTNEAPIKVPVGGSYTLPIPESGGKFVGWFTEGTSGEKVANTGTVDKWEDLNFVAHWVVNSGPCGDNLTWIVDDQGFLLIQGSGDMVDFVKDDRAINAPWEAYRGRVKAIRIEEGVTSIGGAAFVDGKAESVVIPEGVTSIGRSAFYGCTELRELQIPQTCTTIKTAAFMGCTNLLDIVIPDSVTSLGNEAFSYCIRAIRATIPKGIDVVPAGLFECCTDLKEIEIPDNILGFYGRAFYHCESLSSIKLPLSVIYISNDVFNGCTSLTDITIPHDMWYIKEGAFRGCTNLRTARIAGYNLSIGEGAFFDCTNLYSVEIQDGVTAIGDLAFGNCHSLEEVRFLTKSVTEIGSYAFAGTGLQRIDIPSSVVSIGEEAFYVSNLKDVYCERSEADWNQNVSVGENNDEFNSAEFHWNVAMVSEYYIYFDANGGKGEMEPQLFQEDIRASLTPNKFTRSGYRFIGWNISPDGSYEEGFEDEQSITVSANGTLYAQWEKLPDVMIVTFVANDSTGRTTEQEVTVTTATALTPNGFTRPGYRFTGWNTASDGSGTAYANRASVTLTEDLTLYAQWEKVQWSTVGDPGIQDVLINGSEISVTLSGAVPENSSVIVAAYAEDGRMLQCAIASDADQVTDLTLDTARASYVKAFLLNSENQPLCECYRNNLK